MLTLRKAGSYWPHAVGILVVMIAAYAVSRTTTFQACYTDHQQYASYKQQQEGFYVLSWVFRNFKVWLKCGGVWAEHSHGLLTAIATFAIAAFTFTLWRSTRRLFEATDNTLVHAKEESDRNREAFFAERRPWVQILDTKLSGNVFLRPDGANVVLQFEVRNFGSWPASAVTAWVRLFKFEQVKEAVQFCETVGRQSVGSALTIFPGEVPQPIPAAALPLVPWKDGKPAASIWVAGAIVYEFSIPKSIHSTPFL